MKERSGSDELCIIASHAELFLRAHQSILRRVKGPGFTPLTSEESADELAQSISRQIKHNKAVALLTHWIDEATPSVMLSEKP